LSKVYGISRERVRQIEVRAFEKLQKAIRSAAIEKNLVTVEA
jgi:RNA polymerase sigma-32 factor